MSFDERNLVTTATAAISDSASFSITADDGVTTEFTGVALGSSSSFERDKLRWFEIVIFCTDSQLYVVEKVGKTKVYHTTSCSRAPQNVFPITYPPDDWEGCPICRAWEDEGDVILEKDRVSVQVSETPRGVIEALYQVDDAGLRFMSDTAKQALKCAGEVDRTLLEAYALRVL